MRVCMCDVTHFLVLQDLLEREHRNQDAIEAEKADLMKFTEVIHSVHHYTSTHILVGEEQ